MLRAKRSAKLRVKQVINGCSLLLLAQKHRRSHSVRKSHHIRRHCRLQVDEWEGASALPRQGGQVGEALVRKAAGAKAGLQLQCDLLQHLFKLCVNVKFVLGPVSVVDVLVHSHCQHGSVPRAVGVVLGLGLGAVVVTKAGIMMMLPMLMTKMMAAMVVMMEMVVLM